MEIEEAYRVMQEANGLKAGDTVRVLRKAESREMGWITCWCNGMDACVGEKGTVKKVTNRSVGVFFEGNIKTWYNFPFFVLEKIEPAPVPEKTLAEICEELGYEVKIKKGCGDC